jgi:hypothetical protein
METRLISSIVSPSSSTIKQRGKELNKDPQIDEIPGGASQPLISNDPIPESKPIFGM